MEKYSYNNFLSDLYFSSFPPSASDIRQGYDSNTRPASIQTKLGSISIHFQGAATAVRERVRVENEWGGGGGMYGRYGGSSVDGAKPDMTVETKNRQE